MNFSSQNDLLIWIFLWFVRVFFNENRLRFKVDGRKGCWTGRPWAKVANHLKKWPKSIKIQLWIIKYWFFFQNFSPLGALTLTPFDRTILVLQGSILLQVTSYLQTKEFFLIFFLKSNFSLKRLNFKRNPLSTNGICCQSTHEQY